jgi:hypothetical protein
MILGFIDALPCIAEEGQTFSFTPEGEGHGKPLTIKSFAILSVFPPQFSTTKTV